MEKRLQKRSFPGRLLPPDNHRDCSLRCSLRGREAEECPGKAVGLPHHPGPPKKSGKVIWTIPANH